MLTRTLAEILTAGRLKDEAALAAQIAADLAFPPSNGTERALNPFLNLSDENQERVGGWLIGEINDKRRKAIRTTDRANYICVIGMIIANELVNHAAGTRTHCSRGNDTYGHHSVYCQGWLSSKLLKGAIDALAPTWFQNRNGNSGSAEAIFAGTEALHDRLTSMSITPEHVIEDVAAKPVIRLQQENGKLLNYDPHSAPFEGKISVIRTYNAIVREADLQLVLPTSANHQEDLEKAKGSVSLYRKYLNGSLESYGRFHGGWWQDISKDNRRYITISGQPTVELDFKGCTPRMIHHDAGHDFIGDPYEIPELKAESDRLGLDWKLIREQIKSLLMILLNTPLHKFHMRNNKFVGQMSYAKAYEFIKLYHVDISDYFHQCLHNQFMNVDSDICSGILESAISDNKIVLPIHDSFVVIESDREWIHGEMIKHYRRYFNYDPVIHPV